MRPGFLLIASMLVTCAPFEREAPRPDCTGTRTYERVLVAPDAPHARARVRYRERTTLHGAGLRVVRSIDTVEVLTGELGAEAWPQELTRTVAPPIDECPTAEPPLMPTAGSAREETRLLHVTKTW